MKKVFIVLCSVFLTGCVHTNVTDEINLDGTSEITVEMNFEELMSLMQDGTLSVSSVNSDYEKTCANDGYRLFPLEATNCESSDELVRVVYERIDPGFFSKNAGLLTYKPGPIFKSLNNRLSDEFELSDIPFEAGEAGLSFKYKIVSPWPINSHTAGTKIDENTLEIDLFDKNIVWDDFVVEFNAPEANLAELPDDMLSFRQRSISVDWIHEFESKILEKSFKYDAYELYSERLKTKLALWGENSSLHKAVSIYMIEHLDHLLSEQKAIELGLD